MVKPITVNAAAQAAQAFGHEPIVIVRIDWGGTTGTKYYADKEMTIGSIFCEGKLIELGAVTSQKKQDNVGMVSTVKVTLDDFDSNLKSIIDDVAIEYKPAYVYEFFDGLTETDLTLIFKGNVSGPIQWPEGERLLRFELETKIRDLEVGFSADRGSLPYLNPDAWDKPWPLCFGNVVHVPALKLITSPIGHLKFPFKGPRSDGTPPSADPSQDDTHFYLLDDEGVPNFPTGVVQVSIDGVIFSGSFSGDTFTVAEANLPRYYNLAFGPRPSGEQDESNPQVAWLQQPISIINCYIYIEDSHGGTSYYRVVRQEGTKIWFDNPVIFQSSGLFKFFGVGDLIKEVAKNGRPGWKITEEDSGVLAGGLLAGEGGSEYDSMLQAVEVISRVPWNFQVGAEVVLWQPQHKDVYIANLIPSTQVVAIYAKKRDKTGAELLVPIPSSYYNVVLNDTLVVNNNDGPVTVHPTTITFGLPLRFYEGQRWSDNVYVTLKSTVGPNTSDIIKWLFQTYSSLTVDDTSFDDVKALITKYPSNFALFDKYNVVSLCDDIAWQARCGLLLDNGKMFLRYLSKQPNYDVTYNESNIQDRSMVLSFTRTENIVTSFHATYKLAYYPELRYQKFIHKNLNVAQYGLHKKTYDFFIYNIDSLVQKSVNFWSYRYANSWRLVDVKVPLEGIKLEIFDCVRLALADTSILNIANIKSVVESTEFDLQEDLIGLNLWLPSLAGSRTVDPNAWLDDSGDIDPGDPTAKYLGLARDQQLADLESQLRIFRTNSGTTVPAIITSLLDLSSVGDPSQVNYDTTATPMVVDKYANGYADAPTQKSVIATPINPDSPPNVGDKVALVTLNQKSYIVPTGASQLTPARITTVIDAATSRYGWTETTYPSGPLKTGATEKEAHEINASQDAAVGNNVFIIKGADGNYWFELAMAIGSVRTYKVTANSGSGIYTLQRYNHKGGTTIGPPIANCVELSGSANVQPNTWVFGVIFDDGKIYFDKPFGC